MTSPNVPVEQGFLDKAKDLMNPNVLMQKFNLNRSRLFELGIFLVAGFLFGFLLKKYSRYVLLAILMVGGLFLLQYFEVLTITINWVKAQELFGIQPMMTPEGAAEGVTFLTPYWEWVQANVGLVVSAAIGFLVGIKLG
jgi:uncharacterized membrane protein (Fun14 family)